MTCDDDLSVHVGAELRAVEVREGPDVDDGSGEPHEQDFLLITTTNGVATIVTHNEHNGYYGGFNLEATLV